MCLGIPGRVIEVRGDDLFRAGIVDFGGVSREVCLACVPEAAVGDYVLVHVGFAISRIDEHEAAETLRALREAGETNSETGGPA
ncbi:MAG: hydrogenase assembly protein HypC [Phycisphaerae bacterium]|nr:Hydrogenase maturation factor HybG [Phycisphaerales bacterium]